VQLFRVNCLTFFVFQRLHYLLFKRNALQVFMVDAQAKGTSMIACPNIMALQQFIAG
jgi:hypothetical protein